MNIVDALLTDVLAQYFIEEARYATFEMTASTPGGDSPDDSPRGRAFAETLVATLRLPPLATVSDIRLYHDYGWDFEIRHDGACIWCMLQRVEAWLLITQARPSLMDRLRGLDFAKQHQEIGSVFDEAFHSLGVENLRWYSHAEFLASQSAPKKSV